MARRPSSSFQSALLLLGALLWAACAGRPAPQAPATEPTDLDAQARGSMLGATTPVAAAAQRDALEREAERNLPPPDEPDEGTRPGRMLIYSAITGHVRLDDQPDFDPHGSYGSPAEREAARARSIEKEIQEELEKQEEIDGTETAAVQTSVAVPPRPDPSATAGDPSASPLDAPPAPQLRKVPTTLFESKEMVIPSGQWQNRRELRVVRRSLDANDDGDPEEVRYFDASTGLLLRTEIDRNSDGVREAWITYENGEPVVQVIDDDGDGKPDAWERYEDGVLSARTLDEDGDGVRDTFFRYTDGQLVEKLRDANNDGTTDRVEIYANRQRLRVEEDTSLNGTIDTWIRFQQVDGREVVASIHRDTLGGGRPDTFETYETQDGETRLARKEEDVDGDGTIDIVSTYEDGKLKQRAISDKALSPL
jgi:hypothetical protein